MQIKHFIYTFLALFTSIASWAQFQFRAEVSSQSVGLNQMIEVRFIMNDNGTNYKFPSFEGFEVLRVIDINNTYIVNRDVRKESGNAFVLRPLTKGNLTIGSASVEFEGKIYKTQPITIEVGDPVQQEPQRHQRRRDPFARFMEEMEEDFNRRRQQQMEMQQNLGEGIHLVAKISKNDVYANEPLTVEYGLYISYQSGFNTLGIKQLPKYENFWNHSIDQKELQVKEATLNGKVYRYLTLQKAVLLPQKDGTLKIDPMEVEIEEQFYTGRVDVFGISEIGLRKKTYSSGAKTITVKPLPLDNQPEGFAGAVGSYTFTANADKTVLKANEPLELSVTVQGKGNLDLLTLPKPIVPNALELYDPEKINRVTKNMSSGMQGTKTEKYIIVPQYKGTYTIEPLTFSYFDIDSKSYKTITTEPITVEVTEGPEVPTNTNQNNQAEMVRSNDMQPLDGNIDWFTGNFVTENNTYYAWWLAPLLLLPIVFVVKSRSDKNNQNTEGKRLKATNKLAKKYLSEAKSQIGQKEAFYEALERCMHNYLKARLKIETSEMSNETITELLHEHKVNEADVATFMQIKTTCEMARYAQMNIQTMQNDFELAAQLIHSVDKQLKK